MNSQNPNQLSEDASVSMSQQRSEPPQLPTDAQLASLPTGSGTSRNSTSATDNGKRSYLAAFLLSLFLGPLGVDRFYLGYTVIGVIKLLTVGGFFIWYIFDLIMIFTNRIKAKNGTSLQRYQGDKKIATIILIAVILFDVAFVLYSFFAVTTPFNLLNHNVTITTNSDGSTTTTAGQPADAGQPAEVQTPNDTQKTDNDVITPLGSVVHAEGFSLAVTKVVLNPSTTGDRPDAGKQYLRVDLSITNNSSVRRPVIGGFSYLTSSGQVIYEAATMIDGRAPNKRVRMVGREPLIALTLAGEAVDDAHSLLFQVPMGDKGRLVWRNSYLSDTGTKYATFMLE